LNSVSITGCYYKKTFYDPIDKCFNSYAISPLKIVVHNDTQSLLKAARITEELEFSKNDAVERIRAEVWLDIEEKMNKDDDGLPEKFIEQHCWYDLDGDGYKEPYVILVHVDSRQICRIAARYKYVGVFEINGKVQRIEARHYYTKFPFLPSPDATYHDMGWAHLLGPLVETKQAIMNQLHDAGTMSNMGGGFIAKGARIQGGKLKFSLNEWKPVESTGQQLRDAFFPNPAKEPSAVLFNLLSMLDQKGMKLASISDSMTGDMPQGNTPATTVLALLDQGLKVFTSILRRLYRASKEEYKKLYELIYENLSDADYQKVLDDPEASVLRDFSPDDCDVQPVADPTAASEAIRLAIANAIHTALPSNPMALRYYLKSIGVKQKDIDEMIPPVDPKNPPPDINMIKVQADITEQGEKLKIEHTRVDNDTERVKIEQALVPHKMLLMEQQALKTKADAEKALSEAQSKQIMTNLEIFNTQLNSMQQNFDQQLALLQSQLERGSSGDTGTGSVFGGTVSVEEGQENPQNIGLPESGPIGNSPGHGSGAIPDGIGGGNSLNDLQPDGASAGARPYTNARDLAEAESNPGDMM
jgi:chaperonin GroES